MWSAVDHQLLSHIVNGRHVCPCGLYASTLCCFTSMQVWSPQEQHKSCDSCACLALNGIISCDGQTCENHKTSQKHVKSWTGETKGYIWIQWSIMLQQTSWICNGSLDQNLLCEEVDCPHLRGCPGWLSRSPSLTEGVTGGCTERVKSLAQAGCPWTFRWACPCRPIHPALQHPVQRNKWSFRCQFCCLCGGEWHTWVWKEYVRRPSRKG